MSDSPLQPQAPESLPDSTAGQSVADEGFTPRLASLRPALATAQAGAGEVAPRHGLRVYQGPEWTEAPRSEPRLGALRDYQQLWLSLKGDWRSLAILGTVSRASEADVGLGLGEVGADVGPHPIALLDATGVLLSQTEELVRQIHALRGDGVRLIVVLEPLQDNLSGVAIAEAVDRVVMVVRPGVSEFEAVQQAIDLLGSAKIAGIVTRPITSR